MSEKVLKIVPAPEARMSPETKAGASPKRSWLERLGRKRLRTILLVVVPVFAVIIGLGLYLSGGRYISTDNAYVGAQKVLITPDISGKIAHVAIREGQHVNPGDELFTLDREPFALALQQAKAKLDTARSDFDKLKSNLKSLNTFGRPRWEKCRAQAARCRSQEQAGKLAGGFAGRSRRRAGSGCDRAAAGGIRGSATRHDAQSIARQS
jgi:multidrug resistance efflux pump